MHREDLSLSLKYKLLSILCLCYGWFRVYFYFLQKFCPQRVRSRALELEDRAGMQRGHHGMWQDVHWGEWEKGVLDPNAASSKSFC